MPRRVACSRIVTKESARAVWGNDGTSSPQSNCYRLLGAILTTCHLSIGAVFCPSTRGSEVQEFKSIFRWKNSSWFIALFGGMATTMLGIAVAVEKRDLWFTLAYLFTFLTTIGSVGAWVTSDLIHKKDPANWTKQKRKRATKGDFGKPKRWKVVGGLLICLLGFVATYMIWSTQVQAELDDFQGQLYPRNEAIPANACSRMVSGDPFLVFMGPMVGAINQFPKSVFRFRGIDILSFDKEADGSIAVSLDVKSDDGKVIAQFKRGKFLINKNNILTKDRQDRSTLRVVDQNGKTVLDLDFFNPKAMRINLITNGLALGGKEYDPLTCHGGSPFSRLDSAIFDFRL